MFLFCMGLNPPFFMVFESVVMENDRDRACAVES